MFYIKRKGNISLSGKKSYLFLYAKWTGIIQELSSEFLDLKILKVLPLFSFLEQKVEENKCCGSGMIFSDPDPTFQLVSEPYPFRNEFFSYILNIGVFLLQIHFGAGPGMIFYRIWILLKVSEPAGFLLGILGVECRGPHVGE
jgi:hypothetical protein